MRSGVEVKADRSLWVEGQTRLHTEFQVSRGYIVSTEREGGRKEEKEERENEQKEGGREREKEGREQEERQISMYFMDFSSCSCNCFLFLLHYFLIRNKLFQLFSICSLQCGISREDFMDSFLRIVSYSVSVAWAILYFLLSQSSFDFVVCFSLRFLG